MGTDCEDGGGGQGGAQQDSKQDSKVVGTPAPTITVNSHKSRYWSGMATNALGRRASSTPMVSTPKNRGAVLRG